MGSTELSADQRVLELFSSVESGHSERLEDLLANGAVDLDHSRNEDGWTVLHVAANKGYGNIVEILLSRGASVNQMNHDGETPLFLSELRRKRSVSELLINAGGKIYITARAIKKAIDRGGVDFVYFAMEHPQCATNTSSANLGLIFIEKVPGYTPTLFSYVTKHEVIDLLQFVLKNTSKPLNFGEPSPFWLAVSSGNQEIVRLLAQERCLNFEKPSPDGTSPLVLSLAKGGIGQDSSPTGDFWGIFKIIQELVFKKYGSRFSTYLQMIELGLSKFLDDGFQTEIYRIVDESPKTYERTLPLFITAIESDSIENLKSLEGKIEDAFSKAVTAATHYKHKNVTYIKSHYKVHQCINKITPMLQPVLQARINEKIHSFFSMTQTTEHTELIQMSQEFPVFNSKVESSWFLDLASQINRELIVNPFKDLNKFILGDFCCMRSGKNNLLQMGPFECVCNDNLPVKKLECRTVHEMLQFSQDLFEKFSLREKIRPLDPEFILIGSVAEGTRIGKATETDLTVKWKGLDNFPFRVHEDATQMLVHERTRDGILKDFVIEGTNIFDYPKFKYFIMKELRESLKEVGYSDSDFETSVCSHSCQENDCDPKVCMHHNHCQAEIESMYKPKKHCFLDTPVLTHTKLGPCIILKSRTNPNSVLTIDLVPVFPVEGKNTMQLLNTVIRTLIEYKPPFWLNQFEQIIKRDIILPEAYDDVQGGNKTYVALKLLHYGPKQNYIIRPGQEMKLVETFKENENLKEIYVYMKALKDLLAIEAKSFFLKKVILLPEFAEKAKENYYMDVLREVLSHPDLKPAFEKKINFDAKWTAYIPLKKL